MRKLVSLFLVACLSVLAIPSSSAHVTIVSSFPEQFANVNPIPTEVWIEFSGDLQTLDGEAVNSLEVFDSTGIAVNYEDPVISGGRITTKVSGQSAAGVFTVKYRVVGDDGHVIEGDYTFNASPNYAVTTDVIEEPQERNQLGRGEIVLIFFLGVFAGGILVKRKNEKK